ncbi:hypothetical protein NPIL_550021 [Nephila pilipes]|uniref:Uncharacterized protein n=1 Tax=Nephila pilipes TaxID=299642 RepID=A0A8X6UDT6_NEPPI|nr:hypothetical protein NPIL_550021 [Nephila pilipes]
MGAENQPKCRRGRSFSSRKNFKVPRSYVRGAKKFKVKLFLSPHPMFCFPDLLRELRSVVRISEFFKVKIISVPKSLGLCKRSKMNDRLSRDVSKVQCHPTMQVHHSALVEAAA